MMAPINQIAKLKETYQTSPYINKETIKKESKQIFINYSEGAKPITSRQSSLRSTELPTKISLSSTRTNTLNSIPSSTQQKQGLKITMSKKQSQDQTEESKDYATDTGIVFTSSKYKSGLFCAEIKEEDFSDREDGGDLNIDKRVQNVTPQAARMKSNLQEPPVLQEGWNSHVDGTNDKPATP